MRPTWRDLQKRPGRLDPEAYLKVALGAAERHSNRLGFRVMMSGPDIAGSSEDRRSQGAGGQNDP